MKLIYLSLLLSAVLGTNAFIEDFDFESVNSQLDARELQGSGVCATILKSVASFKGCSCQFQALRNTATVKCANRCSGRASFDAVISVSKAALQRVVLRVDKKVKIELIEGSKATCNTYVNSKKCSSCSLSSADIEVTGSCIDATHDCSNLGFGKVNGCNASGLKALPSTNPLRALGSIGKCLSQVP